MMNEHDLFSHGRCDRCHKPMLTRIMSYFLEEMICMDCFHREGALMARLRDSGADLSALDGCGYIPRVDREIPARPFGRARQA